MINAYISVSTPNGSFKPIQECNETQWSPDRWIKNFLILIEFEIDKLMNFYFNRNELPQFTATFVVNKISTMPPRPLIQVVSPGSVRPVVKKALEMPVEINIVKRVVQPRNPSQNSIRQPRTRSKNKFLQLSIPNTVRRKVSSQEISRFRLTTHQKLDRGF